MSTPAADAEAYRRLDDALRRHRGDAGAYQRLGRQLAARRIALSRRYSNRSLFVRERGIPLGLNAKYVYDLESAGGWGRQGFSAGKMVAVADAYGVTPESVADVLGGGDLKPAPAAPSGAEPAPPDGGGWLPPLGADAIARARPYADQVFMARSDWRAAYAAAHPGIAVSDIPEPPGAELFPDSDEDARTWDGRAGVLSVQERVWLIAALRAREAARERQAGTGLSLIPGITSRSAPGHN